MNIPPIDLDRLEYNLAEQPDLMEEAMLALVDAKEALDVAEIKLEVIDADLQLKIRRRPRRYGLKGTTEASIKATVLVQPEHKRQQWIVLKKKRFVGYCQAQVSKLEHRKKSLEKEVDLYGQGYWAKPRPKKKGKDRMSMDRKRRIRTGED